MLSLVSSPKRGKAYEAVPLLRAAVGHLWRGELAPRRDSRGTQDPRWAQDSCKIAVFILDNASALLANPGMPGEEKLRAPQLVVGLRSGGTAMRKVRAE